MPELKAVVGATVKDDGKLTKLLRDLGDNWLPQGMEIVRRPGLVFLCTQNIASEVQSGKLRNPIIGSALDGLQNNHFFALIDIQRLLTFQSLTGQD